MKVLYTIKMTRMDLTSELLSSLLWPMFGKRKRIKSTIPLSAQNLNMLCI